MYRVELKERQAGGGDILQRDVPNVPCGVESWKRLDLRKRKFFVPNVPCGVERQVAQYLGRGLMAVPNVPCGVERPLPLSHLLHQSTLRS